MTLGGTIRLGALLGATIFVLASSVQAQDVDDRLFVRHLNFDGNQYIDDVTLRSSIATTRSSWWRRQLGLRWLPFGAKRFLNETELRRDVLRIQLLYKRSGYNDARVDTVVTRSDQSVNIRFSITEGDPIRVSSLRVLGANGIIEPREIDNELPLAVGDPFDRLLFLVTADSLALMLANRGHPFPEVLRNFETDTIARTATVEFEVIPGPVGLVDSVEIVGGPNLDESMVRRTISVRAGQQFSRQAMFESQADLYRLGIYDFVAISVADSAPDNPQDSLVRLRVQVSQGSLRRVRVGFGYGTLDCFRTFASVTVRNFLGGARTLDVTTRLSKLGTKNLGLENSLCPAFRTQPEEQRGIDFNVTSAIRFPFVFSPKNDVAISLSAERRTEINAYTRSAFGGNVSFTRRTPANIPLTLSYSLSRGVTESDPATLCLRFMLCTEDQRQRADEPRIQGIASFRLVRNRTNAPINASRGNRFVTEFRISDNLLLSDSLSQFFKWVGEVVSYHGVSNRSVFAWRVRVGTILSTTLIESNTEFKTIPTEERFFTGGPTTVRGFRQNELGPLVWVADSVETAPDTKELRFRASPSGGDAMVLANAEFRFPLLTDRLGATAFVDVGQVFEKGQPASSPAFRVTPGMGVRFYTPIGPIRLDVAYNHLGPARGPLFRLNGQDVEEVEDGDGVQLFFPPADQSLGFFDRWRINIAIGEAF